MSFGSKGIVLIVLGCEVGACLGQFREAPPVIVPAAAPASPTHQDVAPIFLEAYRAAGRPRILLMWNRELTDNSQSAAVDKVTTSESGTSSSSGLEKMTVGPVGSATLKDAGTSFDRTKTIRATRVNEPEPVRANTLSDRSATMLQRIFVEEMNRGGLQFVDRSLAIRVTAASQHRGGGDPRLIETDALLSHADMLLEVLMVVDKDAPAGYAFDVRVKDLKRRVEMCSVYSRGLPSAAAVRQGAWIAGANDYVFQPPPATPPPTAGQIGAALARDVMFTLGSQLESTARLTSTKGSR